MKKFLLSAALVAVAMNMNAADGDWYISGAFNNWSGQSCSNADYCFKPTAEEGVFEVKIPAADEFAGQFLIVAEKDGAADWTTKIGTNGDDVVAGEEYYYVPGADNFNVGLVNNATVTLNTVEGYLLVTGDAVANEYTEIYMIGNFGEMTDWDETVTTAPLKALNDEKTSFSGTFDFGERELNYVKFKAGTVVYGGTEEGVENVTVEGPSDKSFEFRKGGQTYALPGGKYTITINLPYNGETGTIVFAAEGEVAIEGVEADVEAAAPVYYNLQGVRVDNAANGLYIVVRGDKAAKEFVR